MDPVKPPTKPTAARHNTQPGTSLSLATSLLWPEAVSVLESMRSSRESANFSETLLGDRKLYRRADDASRIQDSRSSQNLRASAFLYPSSLMLPQRMPPS